MPLYRKKPVIIEAFKWRDYSPVFLASFCEPYEIRFEYDTLLINTLEGWMTANTNDYIIKGVAGEIYPCKPDIFARTYEEVTN